MNKRILNVFAHGDDEILACGGSVYKLINKQGYTAKTIILGEPFRSSRGENEFTKNVRWQIEKANEAIGIHSVSVDNFPDQKFDSVPILDIIKTIEAEIEDFNPSTIFTHSDKDLNIDHRITHEAVKTATRPFVSNIRGIYCGEVLSSTSCGFRRFTPNFYIKLDSVDIQMKRDALSFYKDEIREDNTNHPLSIKGVMNLAVHRGLECGADYAEAFELMRFIG